MTFVLNVVLLLITASPFVVLGFGFGWLRQRGRTHHALVEMQRNADEILPIVPALGLGAVFSHGAWLALGTPSKKLLRKAGMLVCADCGHFPFTHRATLTVLSTSEDVRGDEIPMAASLVCKEKNCDCIITVANGSLSHGD